MGMGMLCGHFLLSVGNG